MKPDYLVVCRSTKNSDGPNDGITDVYAETTLPKACELAFEEARENPNQITVSVYELVGRVSVAIVTEMLEPSDE